MVTIFLVFALPLVALFIINNKYAIKVVRNQVAQSNKNLLSLYMNQIDQNLEYTDTYLYNLAACNTDLLCLELSEEENSNTYNFARIQLWDLISNDIKNYKSIDLFFIYSIVNNDLLITQSFGNSYGEREIVKKEIFEILKNKRIPDDYQFDKWLIYHLADQYYFCHLVRSGDIYVGAWVNAQKLMIPLKLVDFGENGKAMLATGNYEPMDGSAFIKENKIDLTYKGNVYSLSGDKVKYLVVEEKSTRGEFNLIALIPDSIILEKLPYFQKIAAYVPLAAFLILLIYLFLFRKIVLIPIYRIVTVMKKIKNGDWEIGITPRSETNEFRLMEETFNNMISKIHDLKINIYEEQIKLQKAELKHLQLQINPHFFLNSLNMIYQLAQVGKYKLIQEMSLCLVNYFRFMFQSNLNFISLRDEIKHTRNYLHIQELRFPDYLTYEISAPDSLLECLIPPLMVQTFVENTIKYAVTLDDPIHISINITPYEAESRAMIKVLIYDTGKGFPKEVLDRLQLETDNDSEQVEHIGIWNVQRRLRMLYKGEAGITFYNRIDGGACAEIYLPMIADKGMEDAKCTNCL
jgi:Predicted signal transduction protein with a C-terminal ATPase domain